jgi:Uri superfamily endonuclease
VKRHQRKEKRLFWHIDYLLNNEAAKVTAVYHTVGKKKEECIVAGMIEANGALPIRGFGCSDCNCRSHLFRGKTFEFLDKRLQLFKSSLKEEIWVNA